MSKKTVSIYTLGCKLNFSESATILRQFTENGFEAVDFGEKSDVVIINTCTVTTQADNKSKFAVKKAIKNNPQATVIVIGCAAQVSTEKFEKIEGVDLIIGAKDKFKTFELYKKHQNRIYKTENVFAIDEFHSAYSISERTRSFLKVQDGCDYVCSYCTIPKARGKSRNPSISELIKIAKNIAQKGIKEIVLTGVNIGDFGKSTGENFFDLIKELEKIEKIERFRISSIEPELLKEEIIRFVSKSQKFMPHFHIPLQSGSDNILRMMQRRYNTKLFKNKILKIKEIIPEAFLGIDVIVGFPGETEKDFENTYKLLESLPISFLHIFPYSDRQGTRASALPNKIPTKIKEQRAKILKELSDQKHLDFIKKFIGTKRKVLFETQKNNQFNFGFTDNYIRVKVECPKNLKNEILEVKLTKITDNQLIEGQINF